MHIRRMLLTIATSVSALALAGAAAQSAEAITYHHLIWGGLTPSPLCLDDPRWNSSNGVQLDVWECNGGTNQQFYFVPSAAEPGAELIHLRDNTSKCLADPWASSQNGIKLEVYTCSDTEAFQWAARDIAEYETTLCLPNLMCFGNKDGVYKNGNPVIMWEENWGADETWTVL